MYNNILNNTQIRANLESLQIRFRDFINFGTWQSVKD